MKWTLLNPNMVIDAPIKQNQTKPGMFPWIQLAVEDDATEKVDE